MNQSINQSIKQTNKQTNGFEERDSGIIVRRNIETKNVDERLFEEAATAEHERDRDGV